ncbi:hypothetical protein C8R45DRAFT_933166 [Mycena sanguinolenta]|nr:hypothetical protein C8R45DRAFT_933166 [Mycena sanguinolenta]
MSRNLLRTAYSHWATLSNSARELTVPLSRREYARRRRRSKDSPAFLASAVGRFVGFQDYAAALVALRALDSSPLATPVERANVWTMLHLLSGSTIYADVEHEDDWEFRVQIMGPRLDDFQPGPHLGRWQDMRHLFAGMSLLDCEQHAMLEPHEVPTSLNTDGEWSFQTESGSLARLSQELTEFRKRSSDVEGGPWNDHPLKSFGSFLVEPREAPGEPGLAVVDLCPLAYILRSMLLKGRELSWGNEQLAIAVHEMEEQSIVTSGDHNAALKLLNSFLLRPEAQPTLFDNPSGILTNANETLKLSSSQSPTTESWPSLPGTPDSVKRRIYATKFAYLKLLEPRSRRLLRGGSLKRFLRPSSDIPASAVASAIMFLTNAVREFVSSYDYAAALVALCKLDKSAATPAQRANVRNAALRPLGHKFYFERNFRRWQDTRYLLAGISLLDAGWSAQPDLDKVPTTPGGYVQWHNSESEASSARDIDWEQTESREAEGATSESVVSDLAPLAYLLRATFGDAVRARMALSESHKAMDQIEGLAKAMEVEEGRRRREEGRQRREEGRRAHGG